MFFVEHQLFLFSLFSIGILILFHLIKRKNIKTVQFPSLIFISKSHKKVSKKLKLRELILFLLRLFALLSIIFLISGLFIQKNSSIGINKKNGIMIILDNNYQMLLKTDKKNDFQKAKDKIISFFKNNPNGNSIYYKGKEHIISSVSQLISIMDKIKPVYDFKYSTIGKFLEDRERFKNKKIILVTNKKPDKNIPNMKYLFIKHKKIDNFYIKKLTIKRVDFNRYKLKVKIKSSSTFKTTKKLNLLNNDKHITSLIIKLSPGEEKDFLINFTTKENSDKNKEYKITLENDDLDYDNYKVFLINKITPKEILVINGSPSAISYQDESFYLINALISSENSYKFNITQKTWITPKTIRKYDLLIFLNNDFDDYENKDAVSNFIKKGKSVFITLGDNTNIQNFNYFWKNYIILRNFKDTVKSRQYKFINYFNTEYTFLKNIMFVKKQLSNYPILKYFNLETKQNLKIIASLNDGTPFIAEKPLKKGKLIIYTSTIDRDWNSFPLSTNYPPLIISLVDYLLGNYGKEYKFYVTDLSFWENPPSPPEFIPSGIYKYNKKFAYNTKITRSDFKLIEIKRDNNEILNDNLLIPLKNSIIIIFGIMILLETLFFLKRFLRGRNEQ